MYFGRWEDFEANLKLRRKRELRNFLRNLPEETREAVEKKMRPQISELL